MSTTIQQSAPGGLVHGYFERSHDWEGKMRIRFGEMMATLGASGPGETDPPELKRCLAHLSGKYRTRYAADQIGDAASVIFRTVSSYGFWRAIPPRLFAGTEANLDTVSALVKDTLGRIRQAKCKRPYSLLTKFLHFSFPNTFPIYDEQASFSIQMWSYLEFGTRGAEWQVFSLRRLRDPSGSGYDGIVRFYQCFWSTATPEEREHLTTNASQLTKMINGQVTELDLLDKLLWKASGDPLYLGLCDNLL